jgi:iron complex outermembrane receptor protein
MTNKKWLLFGGALAALISFQAPARAEEAPPAKAKSAAAQGAKPGDSDFEVVITAQKREESLQTVPIAVSAFTDKMREKIGIISVQDITNFTPGLSYSASLDRIYLRGIGRSTNNLASDGGTATYSDGVYTHSTTSAGTPQIFIDRVEVLRGPQGTLYGRNAIGGAINVISRRPNDAWTSDVRADAGAFSRYEAAGRVSGPLSDQLRFSVTGDYADQGEGYFKNASGGKSEGGRGHVGLIEGQISADVTANLNVWMRLRSANWDQSYRSGNSRGAFDTGFIPAGFLAPGAAWALVPGHALPGSVVTQGPLITTNPGIADPRTFLADTYSHSTLKNNYDFASEVKWKLPGFDLKYIGGAQSYYFDLQTDFDGTNVKSYIVPRTTNPTCAPGPIVCATFAPTSVLNYIEDESWCSHELDASSAGKGPLQWLAGIYCYQENFHQPVFFPSNNNLAIQNPAFEAGPAPFFPSVAPAPNPKGWVYYADQRTRIQSQAAFGQIDWNFADNWKLTGGLRYTHDEKAGTEYTRQICYSLGSGACPSLQALGPFAYAGDITSFLINQAPQRGAGLAKQDPTTGVWSRPFGASWNATTGTLGLEWQPTGDSLVYAKYSRGYKAGGFNSGTILANPETDPEFVNAYEAGVKARPFGALQTNASIFYYDYTGRQTPLTIVPDSGPSFTAFVNVPKSESYGFELETIWTPIQDLQILFNYAYLEATVKTGCCYVDGADPLATQPGAHEVVQAGPDGILGTADDIHGGQSVSGQQLPQSPKNKVAINGNYTFHFATAGSLNLSASYFWRDTQWSSFFNRAYNRVPSYDQVDLRATWADPSGRYRVIAFGQNVFDTLGYDNRTGALRSVGGGGGINVSESYTPPATYGVEVQAKF